MAFWSDGRLWFSSNVIEELASFSLVCLGVDHESYTENLSSDKHF